MKCSCCGKKKGFFESFEELDKKVMVCVKCSKRLYKFQDFKQDKSDDEAGKMLLEIRNKKNSKEFQVWLEQFLLRFEPKKESSEADPAERSASPAVSGEE